MSQVPLDSHSARRSQVSTVAAWAGAEKPTAAAPARVMPATIEAVARRERVAEVVKRVMVSMASPR